MEVHFDVDECCKSCIEWMNGKKLQGKKWTSWVVRERTHCVPHNLYGFIFNFLAVSQENTATIILAASNCNLINVTHHLHILQHGAISKATAINFHDSFFKQILASAVLNKYRTTADQISIIIFLLCEQTITATTKRCKIWLNFIVSLGTTYARWYFIHMVYARLLVVLCIAWASRKNGKNRHPAHSSWLFFPLFFFFPLWILLSAHHVILPLLSPSAAEYLFSCCFVCSTWRCSM